MNKLTICSVVHCNEDYINLNKKLTNLSGVPYEWLVVNNTPIKQSEIGEHKLDSGFTVLDAVPLPPRPYPAPCNSDAQMQHGISLNRCLEEIKTRFVLFLDPDFFILEPIYGILEYMLDNDILVFGSPYMSETKLIENFPTGFCMFVDLSVISVLGIDFTPGYGDKVTSVYADVGYRFYQRCLDEGIKYEATIPSAEKGSFIHTNKSLYLDYNIEYENTPNHRGTKIDEYFWQDRIFGIHLRAKLFQNGNFNKQRVNHHLQTIQMIRDRINEYS
jgi:hypothetical protein